MTLLWRVWNAKEIHGSGFRGNLGTLLRVAVYAVGVVVIPAAAFAAAFAALWLLLFLNSIPVR